MLNVRKIKVGKLKDSKLKRIFEKLITSGYFYLTHIKAVLVPLGLQHFSKPLELFKSCKSNILSSH